MTWEVDKGPSEGVVGVVSVGGAEDDADCAWEVLEIV